MAPSPHSFIVNHQREAKDRKETLADQCFNVIEELEENLAAKTREKEDLRTELSTASQGQGVSTHLQQQIEECQRREDKLVGQVRKLESELVEMQDNIDRMRTRNKVQKGSK